MAVFFQQGYSQELDELREISEKVRILSWNWKPENVKERVLNP